MKKIKSIFATMLAMICITGLQSCSDDKNDIPATPAAKTIEGSYLGNMNCSVMGNVSTFKNVTFEISATDDANVTVTLPPFGEAPMALPSITITDVKVSETDGVVTLVPTEISGQTSAGKTYTCTLTGTVKKNILDIRFNLQYGAMPMPMICSADAKKQ